MKKSYSTFNLLHDKLFNVGEKKGVWSSIFPNHRYLEIALPYYAYIRGKIFIEDLRDNFGDEVPYSFDIAYLIHMTYSDFLTQIKRGRLKNVDVANYLIQGKEKHFKIAKKERRVLKAISRHLLEFETEEEEIEVNVSPNEKTAYVSLRMREKEVLRGEVLLYDIEEFLNEQGIHLTVEEIITISYMEFISTIKDEGNSVKVQKVILAHIKAE